jgi:hypothetical protein
MFTQLNKLRLAAIWRLGAKCACCPECNPLLLDIDHVKGDGKIDRQTRSQYQILKDIIQGIDLDRFQLLCVKCHRLKTYENGDHIPYLHSLEKICNEVNRKLQERSWKKRIGDEKRKIAREKITPKGVTHEDGTPATEYNPIIITVNPKNKPGDNC